MSGQTEPILALRLPWSDSKERAELGGWERASDYFLLVGRLVLAGVFAIAGVAKLADRSGSRQAITNFGLPSSFAAPLGVLLPLAELAVAIALIPASTALWGAIGALALLVLFIAGISLNLARGRKPDCHCFGQLHSAPAGWKTLARNGALAAVAGFVVWQGWQGDVGPSAIAWLGALSATQLLLLVGGAVVLGLLAGQWWFLIHLLRQNGRLLVRIEALEARAASTGGVPQPSPNGAQQSQPLAGLPVGSEAPSFNLDGFHGETLTLDSVRSSGKPVVLLFTDPNCGPCNALLPEIGRWQVEHHDKLTIALISRGDPEENRAKAQEHNLQNVVLQEEWEVSEAYEVRGTPSAVLLRPEGTIGSAVAGGAEAIGTLVALVAEAPTRVPLVPGAPAPAPSAEGAQGQPCPKCGKVHAAAPTVPAALEIGEPAPEVKLPDLEGNAVELADYFRGEETLVLFWNPGCGFCQQMLPDIKEWEQNRPEGAPKLLFVSAGPEEANREMGLASPVLLDQPFATGRAFGASGTPSAVLVDVEGKVASEVAVGAPAVLELAGASRTGP
jgi:methylamine dehydrogenase accessory protein MauD